MFPLFVQYEEGSLVFLYTWLLKHLYYNRLYVLAFVCPEETGHPVLNPVLGPCLSHLYPRSTPSPLLSQPLHDHSAQPWCEMPNDTLRSLASVEIRAASLSRRRKLSRVARSKSKTSTAVTQASHFALSRAFDRVAL